MLVVIVHWGLMVILSPVMMWYAWPDWHVALAIAYAAIALLALVFWIRYIVRERAELRWPPRTPPEMFRRKIELYLSMRGWRILSSRVTPGGSAGGRVELVARLDRYSIALLFVSPRQPAGQAADVRHLHTLCDTAHTTYAALVTSAPCSPETLAAVRDPNILLLRYPDLERLEEVIRMATWRVSAALDAAEPLF
jgi:hypothetical protein